MFLFILRWEREINLAGQNSCYADLLLWVLPHTFSCIDSCLTRVMLVRLHLFCKTLQAVFPPSSPHLTHCSALHNPQLFSHCTLNTHCTTRCIAHSPLFARLQWAVPPLQHLQAAFTANAELPRSLVRCLAAALLCTGSRQQWNPYVETLETLLHASAQRHPHFHPPALFLKPTMGLASLPLSFGELRCGIFSRVRSCVQGSCILLRLQQGRH